MKTKRPPPRVLTLLAAIFTLFGTGVDLSYKWSSGQPGDPPSVIWYSQTAVGFDNGWLSLKSINKHGNYEPATFNVALHAPLLRAPLGSGGWWDGWFWGIAPWFFAMLATVLAIMFTLPSRE